MPFEVRFLDVQQAARHRLAGVTGDVVSEKRHVPSSSKLRCSKAREDYPDVDNADWLKWIILEDREGEMDISTEDVPTERYPIKP